MLFHEVYGSYYNVVAAILTEAVAGGLTDSRLGEIVRERAFGESVLTIPAALRDGTWPLLTQERATPLLHPPTMPLTLLEKRWLKTLLQDPRIRLFAPPETGLEDVEPLCPADAFCYYDRCADGDPYGDEGYIRRFQTSLTALREGRGLRLGYASQRGVQLLRDCMPRKLEYSSRDDKFRLLTTTSRGVVTVNLARLRSCALLKHRGEGEYQPEPPPKRELMLELRDERNALERVMLHFSHLEKETLRLDDSHYRLTLRYDGEDETELLIRVLSFGPVLRVLSPEDFIQKLRERLEKQKKLRA